MKMLGKYYNINMREGKKNCFNMIIEFGRIFDMRLNKLYFILIEF